MKGERDYVNFLKSFYEAAKNLNDEDRLNFYDSILGYSFEDDYELNLSKNNAAVWTLTKPILDKGFTYFCNGKKKANQKQKLIYLLQIHLIKM